MLRKIEQIRKEPKEVRNRYAFWVAFLFTAVVAFFWVTSLPARMQVFTGVTPQEKTEGGLTRIFQRMKASVMDSQPAVVQNEPIEKDVQEVTMDEFMASSSPKEPQTPSGRPILIATSSMAASTSHTH